MCRRQKLPREKGEGRSSTALQNQLFFFTFKFCESCFETSKNNPVRILTTGGRPLQKSVIMFEREQFIIISLDSKKIYNESSQVLIDSQDKLKRKAEAFQDHYILSFNEGNLHSLLFVISTLGANFSPLVRRPSRQFR